MPRPRRPWYRSSRDCWMVEIDGRQIRLCRGRHNRAEAERRFHELMAQRLTHPPVDNGDPTVAAVLEAHLAYAHRHDAATTSYERRRYLNLFAHAHGSRLVRDCLPFHLVAWIDAHPSWTSEWTRGYAVRVVKTSLQLG